MSMHHSELPQEVVDRVLRRRGKLHIFDEILASRTALLVIDMQNAYVAPGAPAEIALARAIVPNINRLATAMREAGARIVWVQNTLSRELAGEWRSYYALRDRAFGQAMTESLTPGNEGHELWPELACEHQDLRLLKTRYSAFAHRSSLAEILSSLGINLVVIAGTATNVCCESTARDAMMRDFGVIMASDATATRSDEEHVATLANVLLFFGDVLTTDEIIDQLR